MSTKKEPGLTDEKVEPTKLPENPEENEPIGHKVEEGTPKEPTMEDRMKVLEFNLQVHDNVLRKMDQSIGEIVKMLQGQQSQTQQVPSKGGMSGILGTVQEVAPLLKMVMGEPGSDPDAMFGPIGRHMFEIWSATFQRKFARDMGLSDHVAVTGH